MPRPSKKPSFVTRLMVECAGATSSAALTNVGRENAHASARRTSESRVRENCMHGLMREGRRKPVLYSTLLFLLR